MDKNILTVCLIILTLCIIESVALICIKLGTWQRGAIAAFIYAALVVPLLMWAVQFEGIGMVNFIWNVLSTLVMFMVGIYWFHEKIDQSQLIGVITALFGIGIILLSPNNKKQKF